MTISRVCSLQLLLGFADAAFLGSGPRKTHHQMFTVSNLRLHQPGGPGTRIYISQEQG
jgi:hypothetical protein